MPESCVVGVDLGGTNVRARTFRMDGSSAGPKFINPSRAREGAVSVADAVADTILQAVSACGSTVDAVGLGIPGHIDDARGLVRWAPNFLLSPSDSSTIWRDVPLKAMVEERVNLPIHTGNDANVAALGEYRFGSGRNSARCLVLVTLGTGVGGGVVLSSSAVHGKASGPLLLLGGNGGGAELGHICIDPVSTAYGTGARGSLESYCGAAGIVGRARQRLSEAKISSPLAAIAPDRLTPLDLYRAAELGDPLATDTWNEMGSFLGLGLGTFVNVFAPDVIAIGGQIAKAARFFMSSAVVKAREVAIPTLMDETSIVQAVQIEDAGILGAAALALEGRR